MELCFKRDRDKEFYETCERVRKGTTLTVREIARIAVEQPASSFFLTESGYLQIINAKSTEVRGVKKLLYKEIKRIYATLPPMLLREACEIIDSMPAPRFYISEDRGISLYYELLKTNGNEVSNRYHLSDLR